MRLLRLCPWLCRLLPARCGPVLALLLLALGSSGAVAVDDGTALPDFFRESWTTREGLPHNSANAIAQTPDGYLWVATWEGVVRFNGRRFATFDRENIPGLPDAGIRTLRMNRNGTILVGGTRGTLARLAEGRWTVLPSAQGLVNDVLEDVDGSLWVATDGHGVMRLAPGGNATEPGINEGLHGQTIYALKRDTHGRLWAGSASGLAWLDQGVWQGVLQTTGLPAGPVFDVELGPDGELLVATETGAYRASGTLDAELSFSLLHDDLKGRSTTRLLAEADGSVWVGTLNQGLLRVGRRGVEQLDTRHGLPNNRVLALLKDREHSLWVGTNGGLFRLSEAAFVSLTTEHGLSDNYVRALHTRNDGSLLVGTSRGLNLVRGRSVTTLGQTDAERNVSVLSLAEDSAGNIWSGTYGAGAWRWLGGQVVEVLDRGNGLPSAEVRALEITTDGTLWIGTTEGLVQRTAGGLRVLSTDDGLPSNYVIALDEDSEGSLWVGTSEGPARWRDGRLQAVALPSEEGARFAFAFAEDREHGAMWMGTDRGLVRFDYANSRVDSIARRHGLAFDKIFGVLLDAEGGLWLGGNRGVARMSLEAAHAITADPLSRLHVELFGEADGMASSQCNGGAGAITGRGTDGSLWFATAIGVANVDPSRLKRLSQRSPPVVIEHLKADDIDYDVGAAVRLPAGTNRVEVGFAGLSFVMSDRIIYRYRLEGLDGNWVDTGTDADAEFTSLPPGDYALHVQAAHPRGAWSEREATLHFSVEPRWWQRRWVQVALGLLAMLIVAAGIAGRWRAGALRERELRHLVNERTRELQHQSERLVQSDTEKSRLLETLNEQARVATLQAREDALTGVANRRAFDELLASEFDRARRTGTALTLAMLDIDHFKQVNDQHSHAVGDAVLKRVASLMRDHCRDMDRVARWGGEEFALLLPHTHLDEARLVALRMCDAIAASTWSDLAPGLAITASIGLAERDDSQRHEDLVAKADAALYRAKHAGRNRVEG